MKKMSEHMGEENEPKALCPTCHGFGAIDAGDGRPEGAACHMCGGSGEVDDPRWEAMETEMGVHDADDNGLESCEHCGAPEGMPCDLRCPNAERDDPMHQREAFSFDKFMHSTLVKEGKERTRDAETVSPQRRLARSYQEHPLARVRVGRSK